MAALLPTTLSTNVRDIFPYPTLIPRHNEQDIPICARKCLNFFRENEYTCDSDDLSCFCSRYSVHGLTLGELAYGCSHFECADSSSEENRALYNLCSGEASAVLPTHSTVTLPTYATTSKQRVSSILSTATTRSPPTTTPVIQSTVARTNSGAPATTGTSPTSASRDVRNHTTQTPPAPTRFSEQSSSLTTAQAVGVSIAAMGALCLGGALIYLLVWCRRRRALRSPKSRNGSFDFIDKGAPRHSPFRHGHADPRGPLGGFTKPRVELEDGPGPSQWYEQQVSRRHPDCTIRPVSRSQSSVSPESRSYDSLRTVSQLLPDKAGQTPPQPQYKPPRAASIFSTATIFEEDGRTPKLLSPATMLPMPQAPKPVLKNVPKRPERPAFSAIFTEAPVPLHRPQTSCGSPSKSVKKELTPLPLKSNPPAPPPKDARAAAGPPTSNAFPVVASRNDTPSSVPSYMPDYYTSPDSRSPTFEPTFEMVTPRSRAVPARRPLPSAVTASQPSRPPKAYRCSGGSETSFESTDPDDLTPPEEQDRRLSPVAESDDHVKYPKVPRSSNQAVPRSPQPTRSPAYRHSTVWPLEEKQTPIKPRTTPPSTPLRHQPSLSGSTLAAKRLGPSAANSLSNGLHIRSNSLSQASPLKGYGRPANSVRGRPGARPPVSQRKPSYAGTGYGPDPALEYLPHTPEMQTPGPKILRTDREIVLNSPLWEPKLTPSRRGEDLFLSVSLASPGVAPAGLGMGDWQRR